MVACRGKANILFLQMTLGAVSTFLKIIIIKYWVTQNIKKHPEQAQNYPKSSTERKQQVATFSFCFCPSNRKNIYAKFHEKILNKK